MYNTQIDVEIHWFEASMCCINFRLQEDGIALGC